MTDVEERVKAFAEGALAALTIDHRVDCEVLSTLDPGLRLRPCEDDPDIVELLWAGAVIGMTTWAWLNTGELPGSVSPGAYDEQ